MEIKIKWIKRKQMTYENTYRDDIAHGIIQTVFFFFYFLFISNISPDVIMFHSQYQKRALTTRYIVGERRTTFFSFLVTKLGLCIITPGNLPSSSVERPPSSDRLFCHFGCAQVKTTKFVCGIFSEVKNGTGSFIHANPRETTSGRGDAEGRKMVHSAAFWI